MSKFKVGDIVKGKGNRYRVTNGKMTRGEVVSVHEGLIDDITVKILEHSNSSRIGEGYDVNSEYFDLIDPKETIVIYRKGQETIGILKQNGKEVRRSSAKCSPADTYDLETGARLVMDRLYLKEPQETYYNGTVVCVDNSRNSNIYAIGKKYVFEDGRLIADNGERYPVYFKVHNFKEWNDWTGSKFVELIED